MLVHFVWGVDFELVLAPAAVVQLLEPVVVILGNESAQAELERV